MKRMIEWTSMYAARSSRMEASAIRELLKLIDRPDLISFAGGIPDPALMPIDALSDAYRTVMSDPGVAANAHQYSVSEGYGPLREWLAAHMASLDVPCGPENIVITSGSQQALDFLGRLLFSPADTALVMAPTYLGAVQAFNAYEVRFDIIDPTAELGPAETYRRNALGHGGRAKLAYVVSDFANPTGQTLTLEARDRLLSFAERLGIVVVEDGAYTALRYDGERIPSLLAMDIRRAGGIEASRVAYCGTLSKTLAPALRIGWICAARPVIEKVVLAKQAADLHNSTINQIVAHSVLTNDYHSHVERIKSRYRWRRDRFVEALSAHMPDFVSWTNPAGGMFVWLTLPTGMSGTALLETCIREANVAYVPGAAFFVDNNNDNTIRLSFSLASDTQINEGIRRLSEVISQAMRRCRPALPANALKRAL